MPFFIYERKYVGPNLRDLSDDYERLINGHYFVIQDRPGYASRNSGYNTPGELVVLDDWAEIDHGEYSSMRDAKEMVLTLLGAIGVGYRQEESLAYYGAKSFDAGNYCQTCDVYYVGNDIWASLTDAWDYLVSFSDAELGLRLKMTDREISALCRKIEREARAEDMRLWNLREEVEWRIKSLQERFEEKSFEGWLFDAAFNDIGIARYATEEEEIILQVESLSSRERLPEYQPRWFWNQKQCDYWIEQLAGYDWIEESVHSLQTVLEALRADHGAIAA